MIKYKNIRLELEVYEDLKKRMLPMESMSDCIKRLLDKLTILEERIKTTAEITTGESEEWKKD